MPTTEVARPPSAGRLEDLGRALHDRAAELFPLHRAWTGPGLRATLDALARDLPLEVREVASGTEVFDWTVPPEWTLREAYVADADGRRIVDVADSTLHVVGYSRPVRTTTTWGALRERIHTLPDRPDAIPYRSAPFEETWGFCMAEREAARLDAEPGREVEVVIDADLDPDGALAWGEVALPGEEDGEILVWTHVCHPALANDNLSGVVVAEALAKRQAERPRRHGFRFVFAPTTIGSLAWLHAERDRLDRIRHGLVLAGVGDPGRPTYKRSRRGDAGIDRVFEHLLGQESQEPRIRDFEPLGYDERQFCAPGFDLPVGCLTRTPPGEYPEYHTSDDDLAFLAPAALADTVRLCARAIDALEADRTVVSTVPWGEPRLGPRGLFVPYGDPAHRAAFQRAVLWTLNLADGDHSLLDVAERSGIAFEVVADAARRLAEHGLVAAPGAPGTEWAVRGAR